jgi:hypothetical protein
MLKLVLDVGQPRLGASRVALDVLFVGEIFLGLSVVSATPTPSKNGALGHTTRAKSGWRPEGRLEAIVSALERVGRWDRLAPSALGDERVEDKSNSALS